MKYIKHLLIVLTVIVFFINYINIVINDYRKKDKDINVFVKNDDEIESYKLKLGDSLDSSDIEIEESLQTNVSKKTKLHNNQIIEVISNDDNRVSINNSTKEELMSLPGIGEIIADRIIQYRSINKFESLEELMNVSGIGEKKYARIKELITL